MLSSMTRSIRCICKASLVQQLLALLWNTKNQFLSFLQHEYVCISFVSIFSRKVLSTVLAVC
jgi:hypothetical protein